MYTEKLTMKQARNIAGITAKIASERINIHIDTLYAKEAGRQKFYFGEVVVLCSMYGIEVNKIVEV